MTDTSAPDTSTTDTSAPDTSTTDTSAPDTGMTDTGTPDVGANGCTSEQPCKGGGMCFYPGESIGCGICMKPPNPCQSDAACPKVGAKPGVCEYRKSDCTCSGEKLCHAGCLADSDCATGLACDAKGHCSPAACTQAADCPTHFTCAQGSCKRSSCKSSSACPAGHCVKGTCWSSPGFCSFPPP